MQNLNATEYGTYHSYLVPEPDSPITADWGNAIAKCIARLTTVGTARFNYYTWSSAHDGYDVNYLNRGRYQKTPIVKLYTGIGSVYDDYEWMGSGCSLEIHGTDYNSVSWLQLIGNTTYGVNEVWGFFGTRDGAQGTQRFGSTFLVLGFGR